MKLNFLIFIVCVMLGISCSKLKVADMPPLEAVREKKSYFRVLWGKNFDKVYETGNLPIALNSPLIHEGIIYTGSDDGRMNAFQLSDGRLLWSEKSNGGYHAAPVIYKDLLIFGTNQGRVIARQAMTGKIVYKVDLDASVESQGVAYKGRLFFQTRNHKIFCLDMMTGKILWSYKRSVPFLTTLQRVSRPFIKDGRAYVGFADGHILSFGVEDGVVVWEKKISDGSKFIDVDLSPMIYKNMLVSASMDGGMVTLNPETGELLRKFKYNISRKPLLYKGNLILGTLDGNIIELDSYFAEVKKKKVTNIGISSMAIWNKKLVVSTLGKKIYLMAVENFKTIEEFSLGSYYSAVFGKIQVSEDNYLAVLSSRNRLYVFKN